MEVALASTRQLRSQSPVSVHAHRTEGVTASERREGANGVGVGIGVGGGNRDGNGVRSGNGDGHGDGAGAGTGVEVKGDGSGNEDSNVDGNRDEDNGNEDRIGEGGREAKKRKKPHKSCRRHVGNGGDIGGKMKKCRK